jgi:hypothetical protein
MSDEHMKTKPDGEPEVDEMREEYDFTGGARGKYAERYTVGTNVVVLEADVARAFPDSDSVNAALRELLRIRGSEGASG